MTMKGSNVGNKIWNHNRSPLLAPRNVNVGKQSIRRKNAIIKNKEKSCFISGSEGFVLYLWNSSTDYSPSVEMETEKCYTEM